MGASAATLLPGLLAAARAEACLRAIDARYADPDLRSGGEFHASCSSMRLGHVAGIDTAALLATTFGGTLAALCRRELGADVACLADECWARRQYPLAGYPREHAAHSWHQDGALGFDFLAFADRPLPPDALLPMVTCWIALTPCGDDAPGLELAGPSRHELLPLDAVGEARVRASPEASHGDCPVLAPGDAIVFGGGLLHRTHVTPAMRRTRTSIELRFVAPARVGARLPGRRLLALH